MSSLDNDCPMVALANEIMPLGGGETHGTDTPTNRNLLISESIKAIKAKIIH
jgi:hypothetical protein